MEEDGEFEPPPWLYAKEVEHEEDEVPLAGDGEPLQDALEEAEDEDLKEQAGTSKGSVGELKISRLRTPSQVML